MSLHLHDSAGHAVSGANATALEHHEAALAELRCLIGDPVARNAAALAARPAFSLAHSFNAWLHLLGTEPSGRPIGRDSAAAASAHAGTEREALHAHAATLAAQGRWQAAGLALEDLSARWPTDLLALLAGHQIDFLRGDARMLRDRIARALPHWPAGTPGRHALLGMHAFGLEETADYEQAERQGRAAVELEPHDGWAWHAVAHCHEMRNRTVDGIRWLAPNRPLWSEGSFFAVHNTWHLALFHLDRGEVDTVLALYDEVIGGPGSSVVFDLLDQTALLWRLSLRGIDTGPRWQAVAERWMPLAAAGRHAFNDLHAMLAFASTGRGAPQRALLAAQDEAMARDDDNAAWTREIGRPAVLAAQAFVEGDHARVLALLRPIRSSAHRFGGSHAQRDLIDLTLIESALRGGQGALAAALAEERLALRPASPAAHALWRRAQSHAAVAEADEASTVGG